MGRQNYMTITVSDTVQDIFNEFVSEKGITKTSALNDILEMYMLAKDEELYLKLKKKYLYVAEVKNMIADRDEFQINDTDFIFMKLGISISSGTTLDGEETIKVYVADEAKRGFTWFSTQSLFFGMSDNRVKQYNDKIKSGDRVRILFAINNENYDNEIAFSADVEEIFSAKTPQPCPDGFNYPTEFHGERARIWVKLSNIKPETQITAEMLQITSTGRSLKQTICDSQYHFGYVSFKD
ncbi:hypothetical protein [Pseudoflavonifractor phocaeensis]|uniref:hypothetical protein n=1 Tax=Pseudoflavonifractor phocaeensis TaxID=1870988 RepID=UPI00210B82D3|nr:hypothetical protein [Pseudoflavonifractor phocaeensis]MCQ4866601.1 hypothetical protein [Pseudoflavonifractor phocaeensis]